ncbi:MAG: hypothetical protein KDC47_10830, partial [Flavobacteriaceae bacterium]|nr:hypothetical protein [Flavobacteriaceae bacterium]
SFKDQKFFKVRAKSVICSVPIFILQKILKADLGGGFSVPSYSPWVISNLVFDDLRHLDIPWDSVNYHSDTLGFVYANHQNMLRSGPGGILTHFFVPASGDNEQERYKIYSSSYEELCSRALVDLKSMYPQLLTTLREVKLWIWGHAMRKVTSGVMTEAMNSKFLNESRGLFHAHTDFSGISIFEEAFYQGNRAARLCINYLSRS